MENDSNGKPAAPWNAEALRVTVFTALEGEILANVKWSDLTGKEPDSSEDRSREHVQRSVGSFGLGSLELLLQPGRLDWVLQSPPVNAPTISTLGPHVAAIEGLTRPVRAWLSKSPPIIRIAFACGLQHEVADLRHGNIHLQQFLPSIRIDADNTLDLVYQINRPRKSRTLTGDHIINRLSRWSVQVVRFFQFGAPGMPPMPANSYFCRLELDINTAAENTAPIDPDPLENVFDEIVSAALEISSSGDIP